ncbi:anti-sigma factor [Paenibacillus lycopersici]|uniref:anti-sigma factor n=1 Tax=Paenibacillus lycopersici TaxID=2704462 RepID=UPI0021F08DB5|nr:anti-sigma factor [Paenibacillus lycopersici]
MHEPLQRYKRIIRALTAACLLLILAVATLWIRLESVENAGDKLSQDATALHRAMGSFLEHSGHIVDQIVDMHAAAHGSLSSGLAVIVAGGDSMRMFLEAEKLPPPGGSEAYHVWLHEDGRSVHAGTLPMRNGTGAFRYEGVADHYDRIFVTLEPSSSAGSSPIGRIVLSGTLSS